MKKFLDNYLDKCIGIILIIVVAILINKIVDKLIDRTIRRKRKKNVTTLLMFIKRIKKLILYSLMTVFMPAVVMHKRIAKRRLCEKFLICVVAGNFYIINVVFSLSSDTSGLSCT